MGTGMECLSEDQIASLRESAPGQAPAELAQHLAGCARCQSRALFGAARKPGVSRQTPPLPSLGRTLALLATVVLAMAAFFWTLARLVGR
jgi:hypothetical protein